MAMSPGVENGLHRPPGREMRVLVACEQSGVVRRAFAARGHDAWSCDLLPAEDRSNKHIVGKVENILDWGWDLMVAHPPCTRLCNSGVRWLHTPPPGRTKQDMWDDMYAACDLFMTLWKAPVERIAIENPIMHRHARERMGSSLPRHAQIIQPFQFGHGETKATCLWLKNLTLLVPTKIVDGREPRVHLMSPSADRWKKRSRTYTGIAEAMADQWGR